MLNLSSDPLDLLLSDAPPFRMGHLRLAITETSLGFFEYSPVTGRGVFDRLVHQAFGMAHTQTEFRFFQAAVHPDDLPLLKRELAALYSSTVSHDYHLQYRTIGSDDHLLRHISDRGTAVFSEGTQKLHMIIGTVRDITEEKMQAAQLHSAWSDLSEIAESSIHDVQEPVRNIKLTLEMLAQTECCSSDVSRGLLAEAAANAERLRKIVSAIRAFASVAQVQKPSENSDSAVALREATLKLNMVIQTSNGRIESNRLPWVPMHHTHLVQLFGGLLQNSFQYRKADQSPRIKVTSRRGATHFMFVVRDNGIGFKPEYAQRIFGMFKRLHTQEENPGVGMGLTICARIVHSYGGVIWANSLPGMGTTISFTIPFQAAA